MFGFVEVRGYRYLKSIYTEPYSMFPFHPVGLLFEEQDNIEIPQGPLNSDLL